MRPWRHYFQLVSKAQTLFFIRLFWYTETNFRRPFESAWRRKQLFLFTVGGSPLNVDGHGKKTK